MNIRSFPIKIDKDEAKNKAKAKGGVLWRTVFAGKDLSELKQHFVEFKLITFEAIHRPNLIERFIFRKSETRRQTITMLANGSTGSVSWVESMPDIVTLKNVDEDTVQLSDKDDEYLTRRGRKIAIKVIHRHVGGIPELKVLKIESVFRPYWVAFYGDMVEGNKVRYMPIAADGCGSHRSI